MFDIGWVEMMVVVVVMIVVIGPKDLPVVLHTMGRWIARVRAMARGFQDSIEEMAEQSGLGDVRDEMRSIRDFSLEDEIEKTIDPEGELREGISAETKRKPVAEEKDAGEVKQLEEKQQDPSPQEADDKKNKTAATGTDAGGKG
ncbi:MAG: Sec-independent protein translocase protein TatB [Alphaproteobacteria bacterium]|nr:Sec-independent protein translocase protein TatB [Alphaproteobacteria bacterium]